MVFPVVMHRYESWTVKKAECWRIAFELWCWRRLLRVHWTARNYQSILKEISPGCSLEFKEIKPVNHKGNQSWIFIRRTDAEAEATIPWPPDVKNWLIGKDLDAGKDWRQEEKGMTKGEMVGWHNWLDGHEFQHAPRVGDGQRGLAWCSPRGRKESDTTERLNWTEWTFRASILDLQMN